jgi:hypothetical protein
MKFKIILALSLLLNIVAICFLYTTNTTDGAAAGTESATSAIELSSDVAVQTEAGLVVQSYQHSDLKQLREIGLSDEQARMLILQELRTQNSARSQLFKDQYWHARSADGLAQQIEVKIEGERALRSTLASLFGDQGYAHKSLGQGFSPLVSQSFLSARDQIALREYQLRSQKVGLANELATSVDELVSAEVLTESGALEYRLRYSSLATRMLKSGVRFTAQSFSASYMALAPIYDSRQGYAFDASTLMAQRNKLKQLMGNDDGLKILANLDNRYAQLKAAGERYYLNEHQILSAYKIISDGEEQMIEGYFVRKSNPQQGIQMIRDAALHREQKLAEYLGEDISRSLMRAFTSARPDPTTPAGILLSGS